LGCIHQPILGQLMLGDGHTTTLNDRPVRCRAVAGLEAATVLTSDPLNPERHQPGSGYEALIRRARLVRTWGDCYGYLLVAGGWADVMLDPVMNPWDIAALVPILRGAGGVITDWQGGPAYPASSTVAAATPELHTATLAVLHGQDASKGIRRD
jgi:myo-inositol-1(or 4)-monophosphatase